MADVKISQLPLATAVHADDTLEKSDHNAAPSQRCTPLQIMTYLQTAFPSLSWASGVSNLQPNGDVFVGAGNLAIINAADGSATFGATKIQLNSDGSAVFATNAFSINANGGVTLSGTSGIEFVGGLHSIMMDGSVAFNNSIVTISAADGSLTVDNGSGDVKLNSATGSIDISGDQVVTSRQAGIADCDTGDLTNVGNTVNSILAALRTHGLIAPP